MLCILVNFLPGSWHDHVSKWMPTTAGSQVWVTTAPDPHMFSAWPGFAVLASYAAIAIADGLLMFRTRDA